MLGRVARTLLSAKMSAKSVRRIQLPRGTVLATHKTQRQRQPRTRVSARHTNVHLLGNVLRRCGLCRSLKAMEVHFTPEQEAQLSQIATKAGTDAERLVKDAALRLLQEDARFRAAVREGIAQADRGEFIEEKEMDARLQQMLAHKCVSAVCK